MSNTTTLPPTRKGFLDLPLELRQRIYRECLATRFYTAHLPSNDQLATLRDAIPIPQIQTEIWDEWRMNCTNMCFLVTTDKWEPPPLMKLPYLHSLYIEFDEYNDEQQSNVDGRLGLIDEGKRSRNERKLATMYANLCRFVAWFEQSDNHQHIKMLETKFLNCDNRSLSWYLPYPCSDGTSFYYSLLTRMAPKREVSVIESLLMPLKKFPVIPNAYIRRPRGLSFRHELTTFGIQTTFDSYYADCVCETMEDWLRGDTRLLPWRLQLQILLWRAEPSYLTDSDDSNGTDY